MSSRVTGAIPAAVIALTASTGTLERREEREQGRSRRRHGAQTERRFRDEAEGPLRPDEEVGQGVSGDILDVPAARPDDGPVGEHDLQAEDRVAGLTVLDAAQPAGVRAEVAADRADLVARRIRGVEEPLRGDGGLERRVQDPRLHDRDEVRVVDLEDRVHLREHDRQGTRDSRRTAAQARPGSTGHDRHPVGTGQAHELGDVGGPGRQGHRERELRVQVRRLVTPVRLPVDGIGEQADVGKEPADLVEEGRLGVRRRQCGLIP